MGIFRVDGERDASFYLYRRIPCDIGGVGYEVTRLADQQPYHVRITDRPTTSACDCLGFLAYGLCRHLSAVGFIHRGWVMDLPPELFSRELETDG